MVVIYTFTADYTTVILQWKNKIPAELQEITSDIENAL